jgi:hypothetical protein
MPNLFHFDQNCAQINIWHQLFDKHGINVVQIGHFWPSDNAYSSQNGTIILYIMQ